MLFEGIPAQTTRRVPRAKMPSPAERPIRDAEKPSKINITALYPAYGIHEAARQRRLSRLQDAPEVSYALTDEVDLPTSDEAWREHDVARAEHIRRRSEKIADNVTQQFRNRMSYRHRYSPTPSVEAELRSRAEAPPLPSYDIPSEIELDEKDILDVDSKPRSRGVYDDDVANYIDNLPRTNARKTPPPFPEAARKQRTRRDETDALLDELAAEAGPLMARRAAEDQANNKEFDALLDEIKHDGLGGAFDARREREAREAEAEKSAAQAARFERERQEPSVVLDGGMERDAHRMRVRDLKANQAEILAYPHAQARAMNARVEAISNSFQTKTGVPIEAYLAGTASMMDRARIAARNIGSAFKQPLQFLKGIFAAGKPTSEGAPRELSPQAIIEEYERARTQAAEAQARLADAQADAQRLQSQIDELSMPSNEFQAKQDAAWDRAEQAKNASILRRRMGPGAAATLIGTEHVPNTPRFDLGLSEDDLEELPDTGTNRAGYHATALRTGHRDRGLNPLTTSPSLRKLAPLYAGPELSRTNAMKGFEEYDDVMSVPGIKESYDALTERETNEFLSGQPASINPERAPWSGETGPSFADSLETVAGAVSKDRTSGIAIADRAYELLEEDRNPEKAQRAHERFAQLGQYMKHFEAIEKALAAREEYDEDMREAVRSPSPINLRYVNAHILSAVDQVGRKNDIPAFHEQRAEIAELFSALLRAKAEAAMNTEEDVPELRLAA